jgi:two-component system sensor histidine kinase ChiS
MRKAALILGILLILAIIASLIFGLSVRNKNPAVTAGIADISSQPYEDLQIIPLKGIWEFYPNKLLDPQELKYITHPSDLGGGYVEVPGLWSTYEGNHAKATAQPQMQKTGFGTYRVRVKLPKPELYTISMKSI